MDKKTQKTTESPNLKVVSRSGNAPYRGERRKLPRLCISAELFRLSPSGQLFPVIDLSLGGLGLWVTDPVDLEVFQVGQSFEGILTLHGKNHLVQVRVKNLVNQRVGGEFENLSPSVASSVSYFLSPQSLGAGLKEICNDVAAVHPHQLFSGPSGTNVLIQRSPEKEKVGFELFVLGAFVCWSKEDGLHTARALPVASRCEFQGILRFETKSLLWDSIPDPGKLEIAKTVLLSSNFPEHLKSWCLDQLKPG